MIDKYVKLQKWAEKLFTDHDISVYKKDKYKMIEQLALYFDALVFNIVSMICLIAVLNNSKKITHKTLHVAKKYIESKCKFNYTMSGGRLGSATFLGIHEANYNANNPTNNVLGVDFANGIARPQIGGKKDNMQYKIVYVYINSILAYHDIKAAKELKQEIFEIIKYHIECLLRHLKAESKVISLRKLNKIVKNNKILHPLN